MNKKIAIVQLKKSSEYQNFWSSLCCISIRFLRVTIVMLLLAVSFVKYNSSSNISLNDIISFREPVIYLASPISPFLMYFEVRFWCFLICDKFRTCFCWYRTMYIRNVSDRTATHRPVLWRHDTSYRSRKSTAQSPPLSLIPKHNGRHGHSTTKTNYFCAKSLSRI